MKFALVLAIGISVTLDPTLGKCCNSWTYPCDDKGFGMVWHCCGKGPCNFFCCNCDGGCKKPWYERGRSYLSGAIASSDSVSFANCTLW